VFRGEFVRFHLGFFVVSGLFIGDFPPRVYFTQRQKLALIPRSQLSMRMVSHVERRKELLAPRFAT
jgi:hypothetical protein